MGKSTKKKQLEAQQAEQAFRQRFAHDARKRANVPSPPPLVDFFKSYQSSFVRNPDGFAPKTRSARVERQILEWARWLFVRFRVPRILDQTWAVYLEHDPDARRLGVTPTPEHLRNPNLRTIDFRAWYVCLATGGSLYKEHTKGFLTKRETHEFLCAPDNLGLCQAIVFAVARGAGANLGQAQRLASSRLAEKAFDDFWFDVIRFFCLPDNVPNSINQVNDLLDYFASRRAEDPAFRVLGSSYSLSAMVRRMKEWHRALARARDLSGVTWKGVDMPDWTIQLKDPNFKDHPVIWQMHQITTGKELAAEGTAMRHCVYSYKARCTLGSCSIWSLTRTDVFGSPSRRLTIELSSSGVIVQKRGLANRLPRPEEEAVVARWASQFNLDNRRGW